MNEIINTIAQQINFKELNFSKKFRFVKIDENTIRINKGKKNLDISYNFGSDLYNIKKHILNKDYNCKTEELEGIYCDQLQDIIGEFFKFEYVFKHIWEVK